MFNGVERIKMQDTRMKESNSTVLLFMIATKTQVGQRSGLQTGTGAEIETRTRDKLVHSQYRPAKRKERQNDV